MSTQGRFYPGRYAENLYDEMASDITEGDKVLIGCWMIADALMDIRRAIGPVDVIDIDRANLVEGVMKAADILGDKIITAVGSLPAAGD